MGDEEMDDTGLDIAAVIRFMDTQSGGTYSVRRHKYLVEVAVRFPNDYGVVITRYDEDHYSYRGVEVDIVEFRNADVSKWDYFLLPNKALAPSWMTKNTPESLSSFLMRAALAERGGYV